MNQIAETTGAVIARAVISQARQHAFGVLVKDMPEFDQLALLKGLIIGQTPRKFRIAMPGYSVQESKALKDAAKTLGLDSNSFVTTVEGAERWRNDRSVEETIVVITPRELPKLNSLNRFKTLHADQLYNQVCDEGRERFGVNDAQRNLWKALQYKNVRRGIPLESLLLFFSDMEKCPENAIPVRSRESLFLLGLLPDPELFVDPTANRIGNRIQDNQKLVNQIEILNKADRQRITRALAARAGTPSGLKLREIYLRVMAFYSEQSPTKLRELTLPDVKRLFQVKIEPPTTDTSGTDSPPTTTTDTEPEADDGGEQEDVSKSPTVRAMDFILDDKEDSLTQLAEAVEEFISDEDEDKESEAKDPETGTILDVNRRHPFMRVLERYVTSENWGGIVSLQSDAGSIEEALAQIDKADFQPFHPNDPDWSLRRVLLELINGNYLQPTVIESYDEMVRSRTALTKFQKGLLLEPLVQLNAKREILAHAQAYLRAYETVVECLKQSYEAIAEGSPEGVQILCSRILALDTVVLRTGDTFRAILSPLHPLHLWKYVELSRQLRVQAGSVSLSERELLRSRIDDLPNFVTTLYLSAYVTGGTPKILPEAGVRDGIPYFEELAHQYAGRDGIGEIKRLLEKFCMLHPHARLGLRVALIDPPDVDYVLREIVRLAESAAFGMDGVHIRLFYTQKANPAVGALGGGAEDEEGAERFRGVGSVSRFSLEVQDEPKKLEQIAEELHKHPAHVAVLFDPSNAKTSRFARSPSLVVHPICLPMQFSYDKITHTVRVIPASDGGIFSDHNDLRNRLSNLLTGSFFGVSADLKLEQKQFQQLASGCSWFVLADRAQEGALTTGLSRISLRRCGKRDVHVYAKDKQRFIAEFDRQLRKCNYTPSKEAVNRLIDDLGALLTDGLLTLVSKVGGAALDERRTQGLVGTLVTSAWYRKQHPKSLLVSIDSTEARRWLELREDRSRADLFGVIDEDDDSCTLDIVEVKTYSDPDTAYNVVGSEISGEAIDQLLNTAGLMEEIFQLDPNAQALVAPQRREVLRQHLFRECFLEGRPDADKEHWSRRLNEVFSLSPRIRLRLTLAVVGLNQVRNSTVRTLKANGRDIRLIELTEEEVRKHVSDQVQPLPPEGSTPPAASGSDDHELALPSADDLSHDSIRLDQQAITEPETEHRNAEVMHAEPISTASAAPSREDQEEIELIVRQAEHLRKILREYGVQVQELDPRNAQIGPSVIRYRVRLRAGSQISRLRSRAEDIGRELASKTTPFIDNIPGENYVGIDLERPRRRVMPLQAAINKLQSPVGLQLPIAVGVTPSGQEIFLDIVQLPHLLVAGSTMSGKTVFLHAVLLSLISKLSPHQLELLIIDPKATDFVLYNGLPYLRGGRVITEAEDAIVELQHLTNDELRERTRILQQARCPNVSEYNQAHTHSRIKPIVVIIDEYADLMTVLSKKDRQGFEREINRLAQRARSVGIHLVLATQRPTADIVTGLLKANMPCRISFRLPQRVDSQTILDQTGAENLFGKGDMLLLMNDRLERLQGFFMTPEAMANLLAARFPGSGNPVPPDT